MRTEWLPISAAALITGVMALVLGQLLNPAAANSSPAGQMVVAATSPGRWMAMSILFFGGAAAVVLGLPAVMSLFRERRGRGIGIIGVAVLAVGCLGVGAVSGLMLMLRALALESLQGESALEAGGVNLVTGSLKDPVLAGIQTFWMYSFLLGVLLIAIGLFRVRGVPDWVPGLMVAFLGMQAVTPLLGQGKLADVGSALALALLAGGFIGAAIHAASPHHGGPLEHSLA